MAGTVARGRIRREVAEMWTHLGAVWSAIGPLLGVVIGSFLTLRNQRRNWIADSKKAEYKELITTLTKSMSTINRLTGQMVVLDGEMQRAREKAYMDVLEVNQSCLFIANKIRYLKIDLRWRHLCHKLRETLDNGVFTGDTDLLVGEIRKIAEADIMAETPIERWWHLLIGSSKRSERIAG